MFRLIVLFSDKVNRDNIGAHAANAAFFIFVSIIPILILLCSVLPFTPITQEDIMNMMREMFPNDVEPLVTSMVEEVYDKTVAVVSMAAIVTIWAAGKGMLAILRGLNAVQEVHETRNYFLLRLWASVYTIFFLIGILFSLIVGVFGNSLMRRIYEAFPAVHKVLKIFMPFRYLVMIVFFTVVLALIYTLVPNRKNHFWMKVPGAIISAIGWSGFSWVFSFYIDQFANIGMYGSLTTIVVAMLWLYCNMSILFFGDEVNSFLQPLFQVIYRNRRKKREERKKEKLLAKEADAQK